MTALRIELDSDICYFSHAWLPTLSVLRPRVFAGVCDRPARAGTPASTGAIPPCGRCRLLWCHLWVAHSASAQCVHPREVTAWLRAGIQAIMFRVHMWLVSAGV